MKKLLGVVPVMLLLSACGGDSSDPVPFPPDPVNAAPTATPQTLETDQNTALPLTLAGTDPDGDALTYSVTAGPSNGTLGGTGANLTYTPTTDFTGDDSFTFEVSDGENTASADIGITVFLVPTRPLNDSAVSTCADYAASGSGGVSDAEDNDLDCTAAGATAETAGTDADGDPVPAGQDAHFGRDATLNDDSNGEAGFNFTKLDGAGAALDASAVSWACVRDNNTDLIWEVKQTSAGLQFEDNTYSWYNSSGNNDGGDAGTANGGTCTGGSACDTEAYVADINAAALCGASDWRLPTEEELFSIASLDRHGPAVDTDYFPNTKSSNYWSSTSDAEQAAVAWGTYFYTGDVTPGFKSNPNRVRLVRDAP